MIQNLSLTDVLLSFLLIALIVLVVFLIVLVSNVTDTIKKANMIIDDSTSAVGSAKEKIDSVNAMVKDNMSKATGVAKTGVGIAQDMLTKILK